VTATLHAVGVLCLLLGTALIGYLAFVDFTGPATGKDGQVWTRPSLQLLLAIGAFLLGAWLLRTR